MTPNKILWGEGLFLRPQHFQQQDARHEACVRKAMLVAEPFAWGLRALEFDHDALASGTLRVDRLDVVLPDGEIYCAPGEDRLPPPLALDPFDWEGGPIELHLALHHLRDFGSNYDAGEGGTTNSRYVLDTHQVPDLFTDALEAEISVLRKQSRLIASTQASDQYLTIPLLRIRRTPTNGYEFDPSFIAPSLRVDGAPALCLMLRRLLDALQAKVDALYGFHREPTKNVIEFRSGDVASFWLLHTASSAFAALAHIQRNPSLHPERLFQELLRLAGGLMTFSKSHTLGELPTYDHRRPASCFEKIDGILRSLLEAVISTRYFAIALVEQKPSFHLGRIDSDKISHDSRFFMAVSAALPLSEIIESVPARFKAGAPDDVEKLVLSAMGGVSLTHCAQVPPAIPVRPGACYFSLDPHGPLYERMVKARSITIYAPAGYPDLKLELIAVTS